MGGGQIEPNIPAFLDLAHGFPAYPYLYLFPPSLENTNPGCILKAFISKFPGPHISLDRPVFTRLLLKKNTANVDFNLFFFSYEESLEVLHILLEVHGDTWLNGDALNPRDLLDLPPLDSIL